MCGSDAVPTIRHKISAKKLRESRFRNGCDVRLGHAELLLELADALQRLAVGQLGDRHAVELRRQDGNRDDVGDDQDDVLGDLSPGHRAHAAQHRAHQDAGEADEHRYAEWNLEEARGDDPDADDLGHDVGEARAEQHDDAEQPRQVAFVPGAEEVGHGEDAELAQIRRQQIATST